MNTTTEKPAVIEYMQPGENMTVQIIERVTSMIKSGELTIPKNYAVEHNIRGAWLTLLDVTDRNDKPAISVCTKHSISNAFLKMARRGLSVEKDQGYFIVYGNSLQWQDSYLGTIAIALREKVAAEVSAQAIYEGDEFEYEIRNGKKYIVKHNQPFQNINMDKLKGAYCIITPPDGEPYAEVMTMPQIRQAWMQGPMKGNSPAHKNFPDQMAMKTVIQRGLKMIIKTTDDSSLFDDEVIDVSYQEMKTAITEGANKQTIGFAQPAGNATAEAVAETPIDEPEFMK